MKIELRALKDIQPYENNPRVNDGAVDAVAASLREFGFRQPIVVDTAGVIVCGHTRYKAALKLGLEKAPVHVAKDLTPAQIKAYRIADNKSGELAEWDFDLLPIELGELQAMEFDLASLGFDEKELAKLLSAGGNEGLTDPDEVPSPPDEATTRPGDLWILGKHRLLCGDSGSVADLDRLLDGQPIHLVNTDPPYNVKVEPRSNNAIAAGNSSFSKQQGKAQTHHQKLDLARHPEKAKPTGSKMRAKDRPLANDFVTDDEFDRLLAAWFGNIARVLIPGGGFYIWGGYANCANYPPVLKACELYFSQAIIWIKEHPVLTRKDFMGNHEWCFYGWREGAAHRFFGPANVPDTWSVKKVNPQSMVHLTEKPVELAARAIQYSSEPGENVLDLFGGSGSTLIACEQQGRRGFLMELDPLYCDVIVQRWEQFTGKKAVRPDDLADRILDRDKHPQWQGERTRMVYSFPTNEALWARYAEIRAEGLRADRGLGQATAFYKRNRKKMDEGASVAWPARFNHDELSAVQHAMNLKLQDEAAFWAEYQNEPLPEVAADDDLLTPEQIAAKTNGMPRSVAPIGCTRATAFIDVQGKLLFWLVAGWEDDFTGYVLDYGAWPAALNSAWLEARRFFVSTAQSMWYGALAAAQIVLHALEVGWIETTSFLSKTWSRFTGGFQKAWESASSFVAKRMLEIQGLFDSGLDVEAAKKAVDQQLEQRLGEIDERTRAAVAEREARRSAERDRASELNDATLAQIGQQYEDAQKALDARTDARITDAQRELEAARQRLDEAIAEAKRRREEAGAEPGPSGSPRDLLGEFENRLQAVGDLVAQGISVRGTFNARAVQGLASDSGAAERTARATEQTAKHIRQLADAARGGGLTFA